MLLATMLKKQYVLGLVLYMGLCATLLCADNDNTLIKYVQQREQDFINLKKALKDLCKKHISSYSYTSGNMRYIETLFRASRFDALQIYEARQKKINYNVATNEEVLELLKLGVPITGIDSQGKSALDYCKSRAMYNILRDNGAEFKLRPFLYINRWYVGAGAVALGGLTWWLYHNGYFAKKETSAHGPINTAINICDAQGRTPIMNYLIEQEKLLADARAQCLFIVKHCRVELEDDRRTVKNVYFMIPRGTSLLMHDAMMREHSDTFCKQLPHYVQYVEIFDDTVKVLTEMIAKGACLKQKDHAGKRVVDYCKTYTLRGLLTPTEEPGDALLSFMRTYPIECSLGMGAVLIGLLHAYAITQEDAKVDYALDELLERLFPDIAHRLSCGRSHRT